jgi:hypothetical protein
MMKGIYIHGNNDERQHMFSSIAEEDLSKRSLKVFLVVHPDL